jgi:hypothetical protein
MDEALNKLGAYLAKKLGPKQTSFQRFCATTSAVDSAA